MYVRTYSNKVDGSKKLSEHFAIREFACPDSDTVKIDTDLISVLEKLHAYLGCSKIVITSGYRTSSYDKKVGGSGKGYHTTGRASDINCWRMNGKKEERIHGSEICCALQELGWNHGIGWIAGNAVHVDTRNAKYWFDEQNGNRSIGDDWYAYMAKKGYAVDKPVKKGDVDSDGEVTSTDARIVLQATAGKVELTEKQKEIADVDGDGKVTSTDARVILQRVAEK